MMQLNQPSYPLRASFNSFCVKMHFTRKKLVKLNCNHPKSFVKHQQQLKHNRGIDYTIDVKLSEDSHFHQRQYLTIERKGDFVIIFRAEKKSKFTCPSSYCSLIILGGGLDTG